MPNWDHAHEKGGMLTPPASASTGLPLSIRLLKLSQPSAGRYGRKMIGTQAATHCQAAA
jgi:hypothetical protein